ncbi:T9SS type A sorting domain-containing protein [Lutibacter sp. TH_r2]|uniref:T9SS type A sorting domain-containing protein n=1 Tax=Lutibacter sp. TH_r2 TaxID=3082083 RepID=UPI0029556CCF|nr:T9SS type A sorting domain-containing protein [Lutibacter sp. TH_r2]MDV7187890.1 T9SS type A sorting domain-containing protein [Lutibacter sp. TH_r2]
MKKLLPKLFLFLSIAFTNVKAQNVSIPDANFKAYLVADTSINTNGDAEISVSEAQSFTGSILASSLSISDLTGIEAFINITRIDCYSNNLTQLDVSANLALTRLHCADNNITEIDISNNSNIAEILVYGNDLTKLNVANGNNSNFIYMKSYNNPNLPCIQIDAGYTPPSNASQYATGWTKDATSSYSSNCGYEPIFVNSLATGANDGSSWSDAFTTIQAALAVATENSKIWVAKGVYTPSAQNTPIQINETVTIYGGFNGTETALTDRDITKIKTDNATIITGDFNNDDIVGDFTSNKSDNADRLIEINAINVTLDGLILENIYDVSSNGANEDNGVIYAQLIRQIGAGAPDWITGFKLVNSIIRNNYSNDYIIKSRVFKDSFKLQNVSFQNNRSIGKALIYLEQTRFNDMYVGLANVLISDNETELGIINAYREPNNNSWNNNRQLLLTLTNTSVINNNVTNTNNPSSNFGQSITMSSSSSYGVLTINNSLFWANTKNGSYVDRDVWRGGETGYSVTINNAIITNVSNGGTYGAFSATNITTLNPTSDTLNLDADYKPTSSSSYILDQGNNTYYNSTLYGNFDVLGNNRFFNTTIDLGAFEYDLSTLNIDKYQVSNSIILYPNPVINSLFLSTKQTIKNISIFNSSGSLVKQTSNINGIDVTTLTKGVYFVRITTDKGVGFKKFIKS